MRIEDIIFVAAMGPPGGGRSAITQRLQRHFNFMTYTELSFDTIRSIFSTLMVAFLASFSEAIRTVIPQLVEMSLQVYDNVINGPLKPTPNKSHYTFNLRDLSKVFGGMCNVYQKSVMEPVHMVRVWIHENKRVFGDRLINNQDRTWLDDLLMQKAGDELKLKKADVFNAERIIFGDFMSGIDSDQRPYQQIVDLKDFVTKIEDYLDDYNSGQKNPMKLVMFLDACDHVSRITRIIR